MPLTEEANIPAMNQFNMGYKSNTFGGMGSNENDGSPFPLSHMRSGSFGGGASSCRTSAANLPNDKDYGFIEDEITRLTTELSEKEPLADAV